MSTFPPSRSNRSVNFQLRKSRSGGRPNSMSSLDRRSFP